MKRLSVLIVVGLVIAIVVMQQQKENTMNTVQPPVAHKNPHTMTAHGDTRIDNYFWMRLSDEQKKSKDKDKQTQQVFDYLNAENAYTKSVLADTEAFQEELYEEIVGRIKKDDESVPYYKNGYWYYTRYEKGLEYPIYCRKKSTLESSEDIFLDVNKLAEGKKFYSLGGIKISLDNKICAFSEDTLSRNIFTVRFKNLETGAFLDDKIENTTGSGAWANDNKTFFYTSKNTTTLLSEKILKHTLGTEDDTVVYHEKDSSYFIGVYKSKSNKYIIIYNSSTLSSDYQILEADNPMGTFRSFTPREKEHKYGIDHFGDSFYVVTNSQAKNYRLMKTPTTATSKDHWKEVIAHRPNVLLEGIELFQNHMVVDERSNGMTRLRVIAMDDGSEHYIEFDEEAYLAQVGYNPEFDTKKLRFHYTSMTTPSTVYEYDLDVKIKELKKRQEIVGGHNPDNYETKRLWAPARDGKRIPVSIVYKKGLVLDGNAPLVLNGYGSYGSTIDPSFVSDRLSLLDRGFVFAIAHIRGGQMLGREWYDDGKMLNKMNSFYDFIDCAEFLIARKYTSPEKLFSYGGSAGGLLMGAVANLKPELFKGIISSVPFVDVISTMSDATIPLTTNEYDQWGNPADKEYYDYMKLYSPYDNVESKAYPNMLVTTGLFDSQVQYWEPAKWVAKLRELKTDDNVILLNTNMDAGHSGASGRFQYYRETALRYAFIFNLLDITK